MAGCANANLDDRQVFQAASTRRPNRLRHLSPAERRSDDASIRVYLGSDLISDPGSRLPRRSTLTEDTCGC